MIRPWLEEHLDKAYAVLKTLETWSISAGPYGFTVTKSDESDRVLGKESQTVYGTGVIDWLLT